MTIPDRIQDREHKRFQEGPGNKPYAGTMTMAAFGTQEIEEAGSLTYFGKQASDGNWLIMKIDETSGTVFTYAGVKNNSGTTNYPDAWTAKGSLTYGAYQEAV